MMPSSPAVLVVAATKYGATVEIAEHIGGVLAERGLDVTVSSPDEVGEIEAFQAVVLGSAIYVGRWRKEATSIVDAIASAEPAPMVWLFSSGPIGDPPKPEGDPAEVERLAAAIDAVEHVVFAGKLDRSALSVGDRMVVGALRAPDGDFRDWDAITSWAHRIADALVGTSSD